MSVVSQATGACATAVEVSAIAVANIGGPFLGGLPLTRCIRALYHCRHGETPTIGAAGCEIRRDRSIPRRHDRAGTTFRRFGMILTIGISRFTTTEREANDAGCSPR